MIECCDVTIDVAIVAERNKFTVLVPQEAFLSLGFASHHLSVEVIEGEIEHRIEIHDGGDVGAQLFNLAERIKHLGLHIAFRSRLHRALRAARCIPIQ